MIHSINFMGVKPNVGVGPVTPGTVQIGVPGETSSNSLGTVPFAYAYDNSFGTWIVNSNDLSSIGGPAQIDSIELFFGGMSDDQYTLNDQHIYVSHISLDLYSGGNTPTVDHVGSTVISDRTLCKVDFTASFVKSTDLDTWIRYDFDFPFQWNGTDNIAFDWVNQDNTLNFGGPRFDITFINGISAYDRTDSAYPTGDPTTLNNEQPIMKINYS